MRHDQHLRANTSGRQKQSLFNISFRQSRDVQGWPIGSVKSLSVKPRCHGSLPDARLLSIKLPGLWFWGRRDDGHHRGTSLIRNRAPLGPYSRTMPKTLWWS